MGERATGRRRVRWAAVAGAVALSVVTGGCTGGTPRPVTTTATSAPAPTPTTAAEPSPEGAIAAGTQFLALYDYAFSTGDAEPLTAMSAEGCRYCTYVHDQVEEMVDGGFASIREPMAVVESDSTEIREDEWFRVHLRVEQGPLTTVMPDGTQQRTSEGGTVDFVFAISWLGDRWQVEAVDLMDATS